MFLCVRNLFVEKNKQAWNCPDSLNYYTTNDCKIVKGKNPTTTRSSKGKTQWLQDSHKGKTQQIQDSQRKNPTTTLT